VPVTAIHASGDGVVAAAAARERERADVENVAVDGTHLGLGTSRGAFRAVAEALASAAAGPCPHPASDASTPRNGDH
jgi:hypothetical protein